MVVNINLMRNIKDNFKMDYYMVMDNYFQIIAILSGDSKMAI